MTARIVFPGGSAYRLLILPAFETMTPALLDKIISLVEQGATLVGAPPLKSPSLSGYPSCDLEVRRKAQSLWGGLEIPPTVVERPFGKGRVFWGGNLSVPGTELYPNYDATAALLRQMKVAEDFESHGSIRYTHRHTKDREIYFVANRTERAVDEVCTFRVKSGIPELWDPLTGNVRALPQFSYVQDRAIIPISFEPFQSYFVVFSSPGSMISAPTTQEANFTKLEVASEIKGPWSVAFDPKWGGPKEFTFDRLEDWSASSNSGIKYYSGLATYRKVFNLNDMARRPNRVYLDLGKVDVIARVRLNGQDLGVVWCAPWRVDITESVKAKENILEIEVANLWGNRLIGDQQPDDRNNREVQWPSGLLEGKRIKTGRYTFITHSYYNSDSPLQPSGLIGPVQILVERREK
ncbi:MAG: glycosyl hydrolase [Terriglobia bacterium]